MHVIKSLNNNAILCTDDNGRELVAFGKGLGFKKQPYELMDLSKIEKTFYGLDKNTISMIKNIDSDIILFTSHMVDKYAYDLNYPLTASLVLTLADHIAFAIKRAREKIFVNIPYIAEMEILHQKEFKIANAIIREIKVKYDIELAPNEDLGIAMYFIKSKEENTNNSLEIHLEKIFESMLEKTTLIIEKCMDCKVERNSFNYGRFSSHLQFLLRRLLDKKFIESNNSGMYFLLKEQHSSSAICVEEISKYYEQQLHVKMSDEEKLYLLLHVNRVIVDLNQQNIKD